MAALSKFGKFESPRTHEQARSMICCVCGRKVKVNTKGGTVNKVSLRLSNLVRKFVYDGYSEQNSAHPTAMCVTCRLGLFELDKVCIQGELRLICYAEFRNILELKSNYLPV